MKHSKIERGSGEELSLCGSSFFDGISFFGGISFFSGISFFGGTLSREIPLMVSYRTLCVAHLIFVYYVLAGMIDFSPVQEYSKYRLKVIGTLSDQGFFYVAMHPKGASEAGFFRYPISVGRCRRQVRRSDSSQNIPRLYF